MRFPGKRKSRHYFPVSESGRVPFDFDFSANKNIHVIGLEQLIVDVEVHVTDEILEKYNIPKGQSVALDSDVIEEIYKEVSEKNMIIGEFAGGAIGNTLHNYCVLSDDKAVCLGTIPKDIKVGDYPFKYICTTNSHVDFTHLQPAEGKMARALCFVTEDNERSFALCKGNSLKLASDYVKEDLIKGASALLLTSFLLRDENEPIFEATLKAVKLAKEFSIPVVFSLGTSFLMEEKREFFKSFIKDYVNVVATNEVEIDALMEETDPLLAAEKLLDITDLALVTVGAKGLYLCGHVDSLYTRETKDVIHSKTISEYNRYEYSRTMLKSDCVDPVKIYTHINPYMGGPGGNIKNTNGAGDAALAAVIHDIAANAYHNKAVPNSPKHLATFLTYSSLHQVSKYANRVSYEVLKQSSPRLAKGLPTKENSLEEAYWDL